MVARRGRPVKLLQRSYWSLTINASEESNANSGRSKYQTTTCGQEPTKSELIWKFGVEGRDRPKVAWRRTVLEEAKIIGKSWNEIKHTARSRVTWKNFVEALCFKAK
jgi:hypothetical protein